MLRSPARVGRFDAPGAVLGGISALGRPPRPRGAPAPCRSPAFALALTLAAGASSACGGDDGKAEGSEGEGSSTTGGGLPLPAFGEPASGRLVVPATRTDDLVLNVQGIVPGLTELVLDERDVGPLDERASVGRLDAESLVLRVRGSMVEGMHHMRLRNADFSETLESELVEVAITAELELEPVAGPLTPSGLAGGRLVAFGEGSDAVLVVLQPEDPEPRLLLVPRGESGWDVAGARTVAAAGLELLPDERVLPAAALRRGRGDGEAGRVRVAFRVGAPGERIDVLDVAWDEAAPELAPQASLDVGTALGDRQAEWAELGRPWLVAYLLLAELWAPVDVEAPRPGDRALVWSRVQDPTPGLDAPQRVSVHADLVDLDRLGPALDIAASEVGAPAILTVRADQHQPLVLEHDPTGGVRLRQTVQDGTDRTFAFVDLPLASVIGAFGSRTVAGLTATASGRMRVALIDDIGAVGLRDTSLGDDELPAFDQVTGEIAPGSVAGATVFLVPYGPELPVQAVHTEGGPVRVTPLPELSCDAVALAPSPDGSGELPLACTRDGELWLSSLGAVPPA
jgi:hypothetical protein